MKACDREDCWSAPDPNNCDIYFRYARVDGPYIKYPTATRSLVDLDYDLHQEEQM